MVESHTGEPRTTAETSSPSGGLRGQLSTGSVVFMVLAALSPLTGVAGYLGFVISSGNGLGAPLMFLLVGGALVIFSFGYVAVVKAVPRPGAFYAYIVAGLGRRAGLGGSFVSIFTYLLNLIGLAVFSGISLSSLIANTFSGPQINWWICSLASVLLVGALSYRNINLSARVLGTVMILEVAVILIFDVSVAAQGGTEGITSAPFSQENFFSGSFPLAFLFALFLFGGFEGTAIYREEVKTPDKTLPRATYIVVILIALMYLITSWMLITSFGPTEAVAAVSADPSGSFLVALEAASGKIIFDIASVMLVTGVLASQLGLGNVLSRYFYSMGIDGVFHKSLGRAHAKYGSPARSSLVMSLAVLMIIIAMAILKKDPNSMLLVTSGFGTFGFLVLFLVMSIAIFAYFFRCKETGNGRRLAILGSAGVSAMIFGTMTVYVSTNAKSIVGGSDFVNISLQVVLLSCFFGGVIYASTLAHRKPDIFAKIGRQ